MDIDFKCSGIFGKDGNIEWFQGPIAPMIDHSCNYDRIPSIVWMIPLYSVHEPNWLWISSKMIRLVGNFFHSELKLCLADGNSEYSSTISKLNVIAVDTLLN